MRQGVSKSPEVVFPVVQEVMVDPVVLGLLVGDLSDRNEIKALYRCPGIREEYRGVGSNDELGLPSRDSLVEQLQQLDLHRGCQSILWFIEKIQSS